MGPRPFAASLALACAVGATARAERDPVYAIVGARVVPVASPALERATIVLRNGTIEAVGTDVKAPADARVIDGAGLVVTPGLIDAFGGLGLPAAPRPGAARQARPSPTPPPEAIAPQRDALERVQAHEALKARDSGVTTALVIPADGVLPGRSVLLDLVGEKAEGMAVVQPAALHLHMTTQDDKYPDSLQGTVALARQSLWNATRYRDEWAAYRGSPRGKKRPAYDSALEAWQDVLAAKLPLMISAHRENDVRRALALADEFKIRVVLAGPPQAARLASLLKARKLPLVVGVNFDPPREPSFGPVDEEKERQDIDEAERAAAELAKAGVPFGFGSAFARDYVAGLRKAIERGLDREAALRAATLGAAEALGVADRMGSLEKGKLANVVAWAGEPLTKDAKPRLVFVDGRLYEPPAKKEEGEKDKADEARDGEEKEAPKPRPFSLPAPPAAPKGPVAIVGGTLLTVSPAGIIASGTLLIEGGKIRAVGRDVKVPSGATVIDAAGRYVMPGIIDTHSHTAVEEGVNECTDAVTAEVRIEDVVNQDDPDLFRQLAGGVTAINVLHGSCNAIGGQNAVLKLRYGQPPEKLLFEGAPRGIKFALGENPKRSNFRREPRRYPGTRMGVEQVIRNAFAEARAYKLEWEEYEGKLRAAGPRGEKPIAPRKDLRLEELRDVLDGKVLVHSHAYRADEMLMLMKVAEDFGFRVRTFQHGLEAYKVASEIAKHGVGVGTFIDWWGYKLEAYDATPYNPAILASHGVRVSLNSDSDELARRLYWDAAKAVKYGGVSEDEALRMITLHAAWQLGVEGRVGSLEPGKDADVAIFTAHPLSPDARVEMTLVDGLPYFDRAKAERAGGAR
ncbi:MAG TPA: amidohydrolase family protein [Vicinamibacteria bacterium]|nr:amidohydrolase family protein [Vicinamibacteria bacterium]